MTDQPLQNPQWFISQAAQDFKPGDESLPPVTASASVEASTIINAILVPGIRIDADGNIHLSHWAQHRMALRLEEIARTGKFSCDLEPL